MPNINPNLGSYQKPSEDGFGTWYPTTVTVDEDPLVALPASGHFFGELSEEGVTDADNADDPEATRGKSGAVWFKPPATTDNTVQFTIWELYNKAAVELFVHEDSIVMDGSECLGWSEPAKTPIPKTIVFESTNNEGRPERVIYHYCTYVSREKVGGSNDEPEGYTVTLSSINHPTSGLRFTRQRAPLATP